VAIRFLVEGEQSAGAVAVFELDVPAGAGVPVARSHDGYEETIYGLEGVLTWTIEGASAQVVITHRHGASTGIWAAGECPLGRRKLVTALLPKTAPAFGGCCGEQIRFGLGGRVCTSKRAADRKCQGAGVRPWRCITAAIAARSGGPPSASSRMAATSRKKSGPRMSGVMMARALVSRSAVLSKWWTAPRASTESSVGSEWWPPESGAMVST
jgi:hypothetical protein